MAIKHSASQVRKTFALRLKAARITAGFTTHADIARALEMEAETYRRYERAETEPNLALLVKISQLLKVSIDYLLIGTLGLPPEVPSTNSEIERAIAPYRRVKR